MNAAELQLSFGTNLMAWRKHRGLTQEALGQATGIARTYISDIERGARNISLQNMARLAEALGISIPELFQAPFVEHQPDLNSKKLRSREQRRAE
jgi:transcriptional regulator with XRE-family HTH domain